MSNEKLIELYTNKDLVENFKTINPNYNPYYFSSTQNGAHFSNGGLIYEFDVNEIGGYGFESPAWVRAVRAF